MSLYTNYIEAVREAIRQPPDQWTFKSDQRYREVLEHTPREFANLMLKWSLDQLPDLDIELVRTLARRNDNIGKPLQQPIDGLGLYAASNMRYLAHAIRVWQYIESLGLPSVEIVELGGGYGGLAFWVRGMAHLFKAHVGAYWMIDLPDAARLQHQVAQALDLSVYPVSCESPAFPAIGAFAKRENPLVCVSAYGFSEWDQETRDWYAKHLLPHCRHGLMVWNFPTALQDDEGRWFGGPPYQFVEWPITRVPDEPALYAGHEIVTW